MEKPPKEELTKKVEEDIIFLCSKCKLKEKVDYKGKKPPFARELNLKEESYIMRDPFVAPGRGQILVIGSDCVVCEKSVCLGKECSIFYTKTMCIDCAKQNVKDLPTILKNKIL